MSDNKKIPKLSDLNIADRDLSALFIYLCLLPVGSTVIVNNGCIKKTAENTFELICGVSCIAHTLDILYE